MMKPRFHLSDSLRRPCAWFVVSGRMRSGMAAGIVLWCLGNHLALPLVFAQKQGSDLATASLEQLTQMQISVSSFARKDEDLWKTPAAVFVITREDIARSAVSSIPELLRMVPGVQVAQIDASTWAISARGFNSVYASKLLVLVDGRTAYSETYSGVHWDEIDLPLADIERIEVIRGPGAAVWGTNAVNGVIDIITRKARSTMGLSASSQLSRIGETENIRYGGTLGSEIQYRGFASYINRNPFDTASGGQAFDGEDTIRGGGRVDWQKTASDWITTSGNIYGGHIKQHILDTILLNVGPNNQEYGSIAGGNVLSRWEHKFDKSDMALQVYFDDQSRHEIATYARTRTIAGDYQNHLTAGSHHDLVWGSGFRFTFNHYRAVVPMIDRTDYRNYLVDCFLQDEITLVPGHLNLVLGSKIQNGTLAGFQVQPSARLLWTPSNVQSLWAAISRAAVAPSIEDEDIRVPLHMGSAGGLPIIATIYGNPAFKPETVLAYELGYRRRISRTLTVDLATFFNSNRRIQSLLTGPVSYVPAPSPHFATQLLFINGFKAKTDGIEANASWKPLSRLSLQAGYAWMEARSVQSSAGTVTIVDSWSTPHNAISGSASWNFASQWSANSFVSHVGIIPAATASSSISPAYTRLDFHLTRKVGRSLEFDAGGTNLLSPRHFEFSSTTSFIVPAQVPRSAFVKATWSF